ncbi:MAG: di-trans,poly-cis-decaprenylcistransferase [Phycisphaeraceae bacterium]|nr:MAG: di-trans,poly-cis-decaprenylcistransferase [Phycisphaeraceae bacterium]
MDGNGRWARARGEPRTFGHRAGAKAARAAIEACGDFGVEVLTLYSFSSENWKRPADEIDALMSLCVEYCAKEMESLRENDIRVRVIGRRGELPGAVQEALGRLEDHTAGCKRATLCLAINYGSRAEIVDAARSLARDAAMGELDPDAIDETCFGSRLYTADLPEPDLFIRTGGGHRLSNFLLWQLSYAELYVTDTLWPDFDRGALWEAIEVYMGRERRFGGLGDGDRGDETVGAARPRVGG